MQKIRQEMTLDEQLLGCVNIEKLREILTERGYALPTEIDRDVLAVLRLVTAKYTTVAKVKKIEKLGEASKVLRKVLAGKAFWEKIENKTWFIIPDSKIGFIRGWSQDVYEQARAEKSPGTIIPNLLEKAKRSPVIKIDDIEKRVPRTIRFQTGAYLYTTFAVTHTHKAVVVSSSKTNDTDILTDATHASARTRDLAIALTLLSKGGKTAYVSFYTEDNKVYLMLSNANTFAIFGEWTNLMGPLHHQEK